MLVDVKIDDTVDNKFDHFDTNYESNWPFDALNLATLIIVWKELRTSLSNE